MDLPNIEILEGWHPEETISREKLMRNFCARIHPTLSELEDFGRRKKFNDLKWSYETQRNAIIELLQWRDDGTVKVSKSFREFYDGLLFFSNLHFAALPRPVRELVDIFFEIHGSDPRNFPETMKIGLRLLHQALMKLSPDWQENALWAVLAEASSQGSQASKMLYTSLEHYRKKLLADVLGDPYGRFARREEWIILPFAQGFVLFATEAQKSTREDIRVWLTPEESSQRQAQKESRSTLKYTIGAVPKAVDRGINEELLPPDLETDGCSQIFVGPSGCGKTSKIQSLLKRNWGLYLLAGNLPTESDEPEPNPGLDYKSRRGDGSRDTQTWFEQAKSLQELGLLSLQSAFERASDVLTVRLWILEQFRALGTHRTACDWLELQTNCREPRNDVFNHLYRVIRFTDSTEISPKIGLDSRFMFCFDEAQCDLPEISPAEMKWSSYSKGVRPLACMYLAAFEVTSRYKVMQDLGLYLSGTALQLRHMQQVIKSYELYVTLLANGPFDASMSDNMFGALSPKVNRDFQLVNEENFEKLIDARGYHYDKELLEMVIRNSKLLHGRVVWSVRYLDEIEKLIYSQKKDQKKVLDSQVKEASVRVCEMAKKGLKERLEDMRRTRAVDQLSAEEETAAEVVAKVNQLRCLKNEKIKEESTEERTALAKRDAESASESLKYESEEMGGLRAANQQHEHEELIDELCSLAIRSDLLGEATIFKSRESEDLITFGFAFLYGPQDPSGSRVKLKEKLAVDAAIEYFQHQQLINGQSEYDRALINFLYSEQSNSSALGKVAELFFAWHLKKVLGTCADMIIPTLGDDYRMQVLGLLVANAQTVEDIEARRKGIDLRSQITGHGGDLSTFSLVEGKRTAYQEEADEERTITMWDWLRNIRHGRHGDDLQSTFWFPSNNTGPDVLFALRREMPKALKERESETLKRKTPEITTSLPYRYDMRKRAGGKRKKYSENVGDSDYSLVLCAVQIKRERKISDVGRAIATTDPNYWFSNNYPHHTRDALEITKELRDWQEGRYPIVRILVSALTGPKQYRKAEEGPTTAEKYFRNKAVKTDPKSSEDTLVEEGRRENLQKVRIPSHQQYFTSIGAEHDDLLFGKAFRRLREAQGIQTTQERRGEA